LADNADLTVNNNNIVLKNAKTLTVNDNTTFGSDRITFANGSDVGSGINSSNQAIFFASSAIVMSGKTDIEPRCVIEFQYSNGNRSKLASYPNETKFFTIGHPLEKDKYLMHACLEGPEAGVYYRGTAFFDPLEKYREISLPDYVDAFTTEFTVHLTPIIEEDDFTAIPTLAASRVKKGKFRVYGTTACHFDYLVMAKRGSINVEPLKSEVNVKRMGPYSWL
jgi:hypothetical protein